MSDVLREGSPLDKHRGEDPITEFDRRVFQTLAKSMWLPDDFKEYMTQYLSLNQPPIPIGQIFGFSGFTVQAASRINTSENTTSTTYTDLGTEGPSLTGLADGQYLLIFGAAAAQSTAGAALIGLEVNGDAPADDNDAVQAGVAATGFSVSTAVVTTLENDGNNSVKLVYRSSDGNTSSFNRRWLVALKFANA